ncbi:MAG: septum formation initiator family protein [Calditerrivibrio sp.]|nr:septum formation initiator family protein [Calditerrivibrio sp.]
MRHLIFLLIVAGLVFYLLFATNGLIQYKELINIREKYRKESMEYDKKISQLKEEIELLKKNRDYLEMYIRKELNYKKNEEDLYIIINHDDSLHSKRDNKKN